MKTIKELEAESKNYNKLQRHEDEEAYIICETKIKALKDVLGLIDERLKKLHKKLANPELPMVIQSILSGQIRELEEIKKRITGEDKLTKVKEE